MADIFEKGLVVSGGGGMLGGLDIMLEKELGVPVYLAKNALTCVVEGTCIMLKNINLIDV